MSRAINSDYDVFLSFRGPDTRNGFTDHLYEYMRAAGLRVFRDDEEIRRGEVIGGELRRAIAKSRVYAVVFSKNYAFSTWCLRELAMMVNLHRSSAAGGKIILPIFYGVDPSDVKLRTELYRKALDDHIGRYGHHVVKIWEEALITVGHISGWDSKVIQGEGRFVRQIIQDILGKLRIKDITLPVHLTGIDDRASEVLNLLDCDSLDVRVVVLHGMGGIGKTTLASVVYNGISSQFEGSSFLPNVRELLTGNDGITKLLDKLLSDVLSVQHASLCFGGEVNQIIPKLRGKRLLLILDDVDEISQLKKLAGNHLDWLGPGSRIIVTSRDLSICNGFVHSRVLYFYEMKKLDDNDALQLFSRHAFGNDEPPEDYVTLSGQVVKATGNLPLALEVVGRHLGCQSKEFWKYTMEKLERVPPKVVFDILRISYDGLDLREREIFLDIACFRKEMPRKYAYYLWEARNLYPECGVMVLVNKSLIKILPDGEFWIHDKLQDMGREIIRSEGLGSPGKFTRLWFPEDALNVVLRKEATEKIIAMNFGRNLEGHHFSAENFRGLSNLLYLQQTGGQFIGDFKNLQARLMWLSWEDCPEELNSTFFKMNNLVVLRISRLRTGDDCVEKLVMPNLKVLEISDCCMTTTPDVSSCSKLEIMIFNSCHKLQDIHGSIDKLENLTYLKIYQCWSLRSLPLEISGARALRELIATHTGIEEVPESIRRLQSLSVLVLENAKIRKLPTSIRYLKTLKALAITGCPLDEGIPEEIGRLSSLEVFNLEYSELRQLPTTISHLSSLKSLNLNGCNKLRELPELPTSLTKLTFVSRLLRVVPNLSGLTNLTELTLCDGCSSRNDYEGVLHGLWSESQPLELSWLGKLHKLKSLHLCLRRITVVLSTALGSLSMLEELYLSCPNMASVLQLPLSLSMLTLLYSRTMIPWAYYSNLRLLTRLDLSRLTLKDIQLSGLDLLESLKKLNFLCCEKLLRLSNLGRLRRLNSLLLLDCPMLAEIPGVEELDMLEGLCIHSCRSIQGIPDLLDLRRLKRVDISNCHSLLIVPGMIRECNLQISNCPKFRSFNGPYGQYDFHGG